MSLTSRQRGAMWAAGTAAALAAVIYAGPARDVVRVDHPRAEGSGAVAAKPSAASALAPQAAVDPDLARAHARLQGRERAEPISDAFAPRSWAPPPPPEPAPAAAAPPAPPPAPVAPPLPFRYLGQLSEQGRTVVFLARGDAPMAAAVGEVLEGSYRIERIAPTAVEFTYLPLNTRQVLAVGGAR